MTLRPPDFAPMFQPGVRYQFGDDVGGGEAVVEVYDVGILHLSTGRLVACDPFWVIEGRMAAFTATVAPGRYPVVVSIARIDRPDPGIMAPVRPVAAARLTISDEPVATWELALQPREDLAELPPGGFHGFGVESGTGAFLDAAAVEALGRLGLQQGQKTRLDDVASDLLHKRAVNLVVDQAAGLNAMIFECGMGDGVYPVWIGRDSAGDPACFIADLELLSGHSSEPIMD